MENQHTVITIARQFGSGGRTIGRQLADELGFAFYDRELIELAAKESGVSQHLFENVDEKATNSLLYSLVVGAYTMGSRVLTFSDMSLNDKLFLIQSDVIKNVAKEHSCVIVGRCADYVLRDFPNCINVFIHADMDSKVERIAKIRELNHEKAKDLIIKTDKQRASYYNYYSTKKWGRAENYHLSLDSGIGQNNAVLLLKKLVELKTAER